MKIFLAGNIFGDILSDEASVITGSLGMLPSVSLGASGPGLFESIHSSAPNIAGQDKANPLATILSGAMLLRDGLGLPKEVAMIEDSVAKTLAAGYRTPDLMTPGATLVGCAEMARQVADRI